MGDLERSPGREEGGREGGGRGGDRRPSPLAADRITAATISS